MKFNLILNEILSKKLEKYNSREKKMLICPINT